MAVLALLVLGLAAAPAHAPPSGTAETIANSEPQLDLNRGKFSIPTVDYRAPDGTWKHGNGIIVGRDVSPNAMVGVGFFRMKPKFQEGTNSPLARKSHKVALGVSIRF